MPRLLPIIPLLTLIIGGCARSDIGSKAASEVVKKAVENEAENAKSTLTKIGKVKLEGELIGSDPRTGDPLWKLKARSIETTEAGKDGLTPRRAKLTDATVELYHAGKLESSFRAPLINFSNGDDGLRLLMPQGVRASNAGTLGKGGVPIQVSAPRGDVDVTKRIVALSGGAKVVRGPTVVTGQTLRTQTDLARSNLNGNVVATTTDAGTRIQSRTRAQSAIFAWKANKLVAQKVTFTRQELTLTGDKLEADTAAQKGVLTGKVRARNADTTATAPAVQFDWKADTLTAQNATLTRAGATLNADKLRSDAGLKLANAQGVTLRKGGAILRAASADGFDGLARLDGRDVTVTRRDMTMRAPRVRASDVSADGGTFVGAGGVTASNAQGTMRASSATWTGGVKGTIVANGAVEIRARGAVLRGAKGRSDTAFQNATLSGDVRADLQDGSVLRAPQLEKRGDQLVASGGATALLKTPKAGDLTLRAARVQSTVDGQTARATGQVSIQSATGATARAPEATYNKATQRVTASGGVVYNDPKRGIVNNRGDSLQADLQLGSAVIRNARGQTSGNFFEGKSLFD